jgi:uncharacterized protein (TIGR03083 family)
MLDHVQGMTDAGRGEVGPMVLAAWDEFIALAEHVDLDRPSRLPGWRGHEVAVHLGTWPEHDALAEVVADARAGRQHREAGAEDVNDVLVAAHRDASREQVLDALRLARAHASEYFATADPELDRLPTASVLGPLPVLSVLLAGTYELAVHALDLAPCGAPPPSDELLLTGLAALADVTGALAARTGVHARAAVHSPIGGWEVASSREGWQVTRLGTTRPTGAAVEADAASLLDFSAGRIHPLAAITRGHLRLHDPRGLLRLAPVVESVPGLPGGPALRMTARTLGGIGRLGVPWRH